MRSSMNLLLSAVDYLLRLQESVMDFYWHYSSKDLIDDGGTTYFLKAIKVCSQVCSLEEASDSTPVCTSLTQR